MHDQQRRAQRMDRKPWNGGDQQPLTFLEDQTSNTEHEVVINQATKDDQQHG
ncbi:unannotated protein [freshwater metagenome]|uniref:Unannotated protein n=1 Tax=freshwater metagenome TaxID=449393 RepID=A0A6J6C806_9ZZZZ